MTNTSEQPVAEDTSLASYEAWSERAMVLRAADTAEALLGNFVLNNGPVKPRNLASVARVFENAVAYDHTTMAKELRAGIYNKDVLEFGGGPTLAGAVFRAFGARSYTGVDPDIDPARKRIRGRSAKEMVPMSFTLTDVGRLLQGVTYMRSDRIFAADSYDFAIVHCSNALDVATVVPQVARALRPGGEAVIFHNNFYSWGGHGGGPRSPEQYDAGNSSHVANMDWGHVAKARAELNGSGRMPPNLKEVRDKIGAHLEIRSWKGVPEKQAVKDRVSSAVRARYDWLSEEDLLTRRVRIAARRRLGGA